jgi:hypothetical protein
VKQRQHPVMPAPFPLGPRVVSYHNRSGRRASRLLPARLRPLREIGHQHGDRHLTKVLGVPLQNRGEPIAYGWLARHFDPLVTGIPNHTPLDNGVQSECTGLGKISDEW